ncbi:MAG: hypothetical protein P4L69_19365 [Desulfosporosinus sp.]|nr:hypothetical protein [Desulfosporosinus sp.]
MGSKLTRYEFNPGKNEQIETTTLHEIEGIISLPFNIKEVFEVRHNILPTRKTIGKKCVAYFGEIQIQVYCIDSSDMSIRLAENVLHYRGFNFIDNKELSLQPIIRMNTTVKDIFVEIMELNQLKIDGLLSINSILSIERELVLDELQYLKTEPSENNKERTECEEADKFNVIPIPAMQKNYTEEIRCQEGPNCQESAEIYTQVSINKTQEVIITLD